MKSLITLKQERRSGDFSKSRCQSETIIIFESVIIMASDSNQIYRQAIEDYLDSFDLLLDLPDEKQLATNLGAGNVPIEVFSRRVEAIALQSRTLNKLVRTHRMSDNLRTREEVSNQLIVQILADFALASELLQLIAEERAGRVSSQFARTVRASSLKDIIRILNQSMRDPFLKTVDTLQVEAKLNVNIVYVSPHETKKILADTVFQTVNFVYRRVCETGLVLVRDLITHINESKTTEHISQLVPLTSYINKTESDGPKLGVLVQITKEFLSNIDEKFSIIVEKEDAEIAYTEVVEWLNVINALRNLGQFETEVENLYSFSQFKRDVESWIAAKVVTAETINQISTEVYSFETRFSNLSVHLNRLLTEISLAKAIPLAQIEQIVLNMQMRLLILLIYLGHSYIGYGHSKFTDSVAKSFSQVVQEKLEI